jgi:hypothetical protein
MPLSELRKPENVAAIKAKYAERIERLKRQRRNRRLVETLADLEEEQELPKACLICQL